MTRRPAPPRPARCVCAPRPSLPLPLPDIAYGVGVAADNSTLAQEYNTVEKLLAQPRLQRWLKYARGLKPLAAKAN
jgi:hypothetical protein